LEGKTNTRAIGMNEFAEKAFDLALSVLDGGRESPQNASGATRPDPQPRHRVKDLPGDETSTTAPVGPGAKAVVLARPAKSPAIPDSALDPTSENYRLTFQALADHGLMDGLIKPEESEVILGCDRHWLGDVSQESKYTPEAARADSQAHLAELSRKFATGDATAHTETTWSHEDFVAEYRLKLLALKADRRNQEVISAPVARQIRTRAGNAVNSLADILEGPGRALAENFAAPYEPAPTVKMLRRMAANFLDLNRGNSGRPLSMVENLPLI
jgi:hypothetical protein